METDILEFLEVNRLPEKGELYINEDRTLYRCRNVDFNTENGWPGRKIRTIIPILHRTGLNMFETERLADIVWKKGLLPGKHVNINEVKSDEVMKYMELVESLKGFKKAYSRLVDSWNDAKAELAEDYPFEQSFYEYVNIHQWVETSIKKLKENESSK